MWSLAVVVVDKFERHGLQMALIDDDDVVKTLSSEIVRTIRSPIAFAVGARGGIPRAIVLEWRNVCDEWNVARYPDLGRNRRNRLTTSSCGRAGRTKLDLSSANVHRQRNISTHRWSRLSRHARDSSVEWAMT